MKIGRPILTMWNSIYFMMAPYHITYICHLIAASARDCQLLAHCLLIDCLSMNYALSLSMARPCAGHPERPDHWGHLPRSPRPRDSRARGGSMGPYHGLGWAHVIGICNRQSICNMY